MNNTRRENNFWYFFLLVEKGEKDSGESWRICFKLRAYSGMDLPL